MRIELPPFTCVHNSCKDCVYEGTDDCIPCSCQLGCLNFKQAPIDRNPPPEKRNALAQEKPMLRGGYHRQLIAYVCSPYRGNIERNVAYAREIMAEAIKRGFAPIVPHLYIPAVLDDNDPAQRQQGLGIGVTLLEACDYVVVGGRYGISEGMRNEIRTAMRLAKGIVWIDDENAEKRVVFDKPLKP